MKLTLDLENLESIVKATLEENSKSAIDDAIHSVVREKVDRALEENCDTAISHIIEGYIKEYLSTAKIQVGNSWNGDGVKEFTVEEYLKDQVATIFKDQSFNIETKNSWGSKETKKVSFQDFITEKFDVETYLKRDLEKLASDVKRDVDYKIRTLFDESMKRTLADNIFTIVSASETYQKVKSSMNLLGE